MRGEVTVRELWQRLSVNGSFPSFFWGEQRRPAGLKKADYLWVGHLSSGLYLADSGRYILPSWCRHVVLFKADTGQDSLAGWRCHINLFCLCYKTLLSKHVGFGSELTRVIHKVNYCLLFCFSIKAWAGLGGIWLFGIRRSGVLHLGACR